MKRGYTYGILLFIIVLSCEFNLFAQTNPAPHPLAEGPFEFLKMPSSTDIIYPASMQGWRGPITYVNQSDSVPVDVQATADEPLVANSSAEESSSVRNETPTSGTASGISLFYDEETPANQANGYPLALVTSVNTQKMKDIMISWSAVVIFDYLDGDAGVQLQYRIGQSGNWKNVGSHRFSSAGNVDIIKHFTSTLLASEVNDQPEIQFRWFYYNESLLYNLGDRIGIFNIRVAGEHINPLATHPTPYSLAQADYVFNGFENNSITEYPASMNGWGKNRLLVASTATPPTGVQPNYDMPLMPALNNAASISINNNGTSGISLKNENIAVKQPLAIVVGLDTRYTGKISLQWTGRTLNANAAWLRAGIQAQYRTDTVGDWKNIADSNGVRQRYTSSGSSNSNIPPSVFGPVELPSEMEGRSNAQIRWLFFSTTEDNPATTSPTDRAAVDSIIIKAEERSIPLFPIANFGFSVNGFEVTFSDSSQNDPTSWSWNFGDGNTSAIQNPVHIYADTGSYDVTLIVSNLVGADTITKTVVITSVNESPIANNDTASTTKNTFVLIAAASNDDPTDGPDTLYAIVQQPQHGSALIDTNGTITYTPATDYVGNDTLSYSVCDGATPNLCDTAFVFITVLDSVAENQSPIANNDTASTTKNTLVLIAAAANDDPTDGPDTLYAIVQQPQHGSALIDTNGTITYTPSTDYIGNDTLSYSVCDGATPELCDSALVFITVLDSVAENQPPVANDDSAATNKNQQVAVDAAANDDATDGPEVNVSIVDSAKHGTVTIDLDNGVIIYSPDNNFVGRDTFSYRLCDGATPELCDSALVFITVNDVAPNQAPVANDDSATTLKNNAVAVDAAANDDPTDGPQAKYGITVAPKHGTATINSTNGMINYTPATGFIGNDSLTYSLCDGATPELCDMATVFITVEDEPANQPPVANDDVTSIKCGKTKKVNILANDKDNDGMLDPATVNIIQDVLFGEAILNADGSISYTANDDYKGKDSLKYMVSDDKSAESNIATLRITVDCAVGIEDYKGELPVSIYPNPVNEILTVRLADGEQLQKLEIHNMQGSLVMGSEKPEAGELNVSVLEPGVYSLSIITGKGKITQRFCVIR